MNKALSLTQVLLALGASMGACDASAKTLITLYRFSKEYVLSSPLVRGNGLLYGTAVLKSGATTVFGFDPVTRHETDLYTFTAARAGGAPPVMLYANDSLYGSFRYGGTAREGLLFRIDLATDTETDLLDFAAIRHGSQAVGPGGIVFAHGGIFGISASESPDEGVLYRLSRKSGKFKTVSTLTVDRGLLSMPEAGALLCDAGVFYGVTIGGPGEGGVFAFDMRTKTETQLYEFGSDGYDAYPNGDLTLGGGSLYLTVQDGETGCGAIYTVQGDHNAMQTFGRSLFNFACDSAEGSFVNGPVAYRDNALYGTTMLGGDLTDGQGYGTIFEYDLGTGTEAVLYQFSGGASGDYPRAGPTFLHGAWYGTTSGQPVNGSGRGTIYKFKP